MGKIRRRRRNYTNYIIIACICVFSVMGIGYGYLQQSLNIDMSLSRKKTTNIGGKGVVIVSSGDGLYEDQYEDGRYIYRGSEPNNYIQFNNELWRIIAKEADGTYKIIRDKPIGTRAFDESNHRLTANNTYCDNPSWGCSVYGKISGTYTLGNLSGTVTEDSSVAEYLNGEYYKSLTAIAKNQIQTHAFNIGGVLQLDQSGNDSIAKNLQQEKAYQWTGNIGLPNVTDILRASTDSSCISATDDYNTYDACKTSYLVIGMQNDTYFLTTNGYAREGFSASHNVWYVRRTSSGVRLGSDGANYSDRGVRPTIYLNSNIQIISGDGSNTNPYIIQ